MTVSRQRTRKRAPDSALAQGLIMVFLLITILMVFVPLVITILNSVKTTYEMNTGVFTVPRNPRWDNWSTALVVMGPNMINSILVCLISTAGIIFFGSMASFAFVRHRFPGKEFIFYAILALMMIPGVISLTPQYINIVNFGLKDTWWALILPYLAGNQVGTIFLFRTFLGTQPGELYEAAKIDGAREFQMYLRISLPLSKSVIAIQAISCVLSIYNDYLWPQLVIENERAQMLMPILKAIATQYTGYAAEQQGVSFAMYLLSGLPLIVVSMFSMKYFINGELAGALKI